MNISSSKTRNFQGFSLVELLVGMAISLLVTAVAVGYMVSSSRTLTHQNNNDLIQENARFSFEILSSEFRIAGLNNTNNPNLVNTADDVKVQGLSSEKICNSDASEPTGISSGDCNKDNLSNNSDRIAFEYATDSVTTCNGSVVNTFSKIVSVYWVADLDNSGAGDGVSSLYCQSYQSKISPVTGDYDTFELLGTVTPLVDGIESMQVLYGVDTDGDTDPATSNTPEGDSIVNEYKKFDAISTDDRPNILSAKIGFLISGGQSIASEANTVKNEERTFVVLGETIKITDGVTRSSLSTTIDFPNMPVARF